MLLRRLFSSVNLEADILRKKMKYLATKRGIVENELIFDKFINLHFDQLKETDINLFNDLLHEYDWICLDNGSEKSSRKILKF